MNTPELVDEAGIVRLAQGSPESVEASGVDSNITTLIYRAIGLKKRQHVPTRGTLVAVPIVNESAFLVHQRESPIDGKDLARVFPGHSDGTVSEQIAYHLTHSVLKHGNLFVDLRSAGTYY